MKKLYLKGTPTEKQQQLFDSRAKYTAYGGARGGGKSWALRRKLVLMCFHYPGLRCLLIRRSYPELQHNHILTLRAELGGAVQYSELQKRFIFPNGSSLKMGYLSCDGDTLQYQGLEYDVIALDEATQLTEYQFGVLKACLRGANSNPKRMYLSCNPGGVGHGWVKRLFIDRRYNEGEKPEEYRFIQATVFDNTVLLKTDAEYVSQLQSLPEKLRDAWLWGRWDVFEGQFFPEFSSENHVVPPGEYPPARRMIGGLDYGFDTTAFVLLCADAEGNVTVVRELALPDLTLSQAARRVAEVCRGENVEYIAASPDLWNRRQDTGKSGFEAMSAVEGLPALLRADDRRIAGWRELREYLSGSCGQKLSVWSSCPQLIHCLSSLIYDADRPEDCSEFPHDITHLPEALRYAVMSRIAAADTARELYERRKARYERRNSMENY